MAGDTYIAGDVYHVDAPGLADFGGNPLLAVFVCYLDLYISIYEI